MSKQAITISLSAEEREELERALRASTSEQRLVLRSRIVLAAAQGETNVAIAKRLDVSLPVVMKWRARFARERLPGLHDLPRAGPPARYSEATERRILAQLDPPAPKGHATWTGDLVATALGDVSADHVWRILRQHNIHLRRKRSWCLSTDPEFARKAADIVGLYLNPPENAIVLSVDEKPAIQVLEGGQGWLRLPNGRALRGFGFEYKRHGTTTLFAALNVTTGLVTAGHYPRRRREEFLDFMNGVLREYPDQELHVVLDNLNTHKPKDDRWLASHPNVHFHFTPTHASWLNQVECWFSILTRRALHGLSAVSVKQVCAAIDAFIEVYNPEAHPFAWKKASVGQGRLHQKYSDLCK